MRYTQTARNDLADIAAYIAESSGSRAVAAAFAAQVRLRCTKLASLPGIMGKNRSELQPDIRSVAFKGYVIFFRYRQQVFEVVNILEGHRDIASFYGEDEPLPTP